MSESNPEQNERIVHDTARIYQGLVDEPIGEINGVPWPSPDLALRIAAKGSLFMHGGAEGKYRTADPDALAEVTKKILPQAPRQSFEGEE